MDIWKSTVESVGRLMKFELDFYKGKKVFVTGQTDPDEKLV